jgi:acyl-CoA synthetase (AMP-forming)/AMP-acid ligase II
MPSLYDHLAYWASIRPEAPYVIEAETGRALTYRQCLTAVQTMHRWLDVRPTNLYLALPGGIANAVIWLSALTGGHTVVPLAPEASARDSMHVANLFAPNVVIADPSTPPAQERFSHVRARRMLGDQCEELLTRDALARGNDCTAPLPLREGRACLMTSGSTGEPKVVVLTERQIVWTAGHVARSHALTPADRGLAVLPFSHVNAPVVSLCASLVAGSTVIIAPRFSLSRFWPWIERHHATWASVVPTILALLLRNEQPSFHQGALRFVRTAAAPLPSTHLRQFEQRFGVPVIETYGLTEAASQVCANPVPPGRRKPGSVGVPVGISLRICSPQQAGEVSTLGDVTPSTTGEICIAGPSVISAYAGGGGADRFQDGWLRTGDLGYQDAGGYVYIVGRIHDVINRGGEKIAPREIEDVLLAHPSVLDAAAIGRPDPIYGEQVVAHVVVREAWTLALEGCLRTHCTANLSRNKVPASFVAEDELPRAATGKIDRNHLRSDAVSQGLQQRDGHVA